MGEPIPFRRPPLRDTQPDQTAPEDRDLLAAAQREVDEIIVSIEQPRNFEMPDIDPAWFGKDAPLVEDYLKRLQEWLTYPYIEDKFGMDSAARENWKHAFYAKYGKVGDSVLRPLLNNKFRRNILGRPNTLFDNLEHFFEDGTIHEQGVGRKLSKIWDTKKITSSFENYDSLSIEKRRKFIGQYEDKVMRALQVLAAEGKPRFWVVK